MLVREDDADDESARTYGTKCDGNKIPKIATPMKTFEDIIVEKHRRTQWTSWHALECCSGCLVARAWRCAFVRGGWPAAAATGESVVLLRLLTQRSPSRSCGAGIGIFRLLLSFHFAPPEAVFVLRNNLIMRILSKLFLTGLTLAASPAKACDSTVDIVLETSGASGFDNNGNDFDILRELVLLTGKCHHWFCLHLCASIVMQSSGDE